MDDITKRTQELIEAGFSADRVELWRKHMIAGRPLQARRALFKRLCQGRSRQRNAPCQAAAEEGSNYCRFHGRGGPKTSEGKARIAEAQRRRWARWRVQHVFDGA